MIRKAEKKDIAAVAKSYEQLLAYETEHGTSSNWVPGLYPVERTARNALNRGDLYVLEEKGAVRGSMILNQEQPDEYKTVSWQISAADNQVLVIHTLCIPPQEAGKGRGKQMVAFALEKAQKMGCLAVRLDTWAENKTAASLYRKMGFRLAGTGPMLLQGIIPEQQIYFERKGA